MSYRLLPEFLYFYNHFQHATTTGIDIVVSLDAADHTVFQWKEFRSFFLQRMGGGGNECIRMRINRYDSVIPHTP